MSVSRGGSGMCIRDRSERAEGVLDAYTEARLGVVHAAAEAIAGIAARTGRTAPDVIT